MSDIVVEARDLTFRYRRASEAVLDGLHAEFAGGSVTVITGASGSGKSTLLYVLALLARPTAGSVAWRGRRVDDLPDGSRSQLRARRAGFVFQDAMLDPAKTVMANVCEQAVFSGLDRRAAAQRARALLEQFGLLHRADHRPGEVSGGQAQRVALCRALLISPTIVFADEPTGNLDADAAEVVVAALEEQARTGTCVIIATHDLSLARRADTCLTL
jgi:ABC-type lipoprotein export system ATPase subunit